MNWLPKKSVVVPIDFSDESWEALYAARSMVADPAHIYVIHVLQELSPMEPGELWDTVDNQTRADHVRKALLEKMPDDLKAANVQVAFGDPGHRIADYAEECEAELVVLPSTGRTGFARLLIGSVAERVVRLSHCPVLVLRK